MGGECLKNNGVYCVLQNQNIMTNEQLTAMSITELRELNSKVIAYIKMKNQIAAELNKGLIAPGMTVGVKTNNPQLMGHKFLLEKINKKYAVCKDLVTSKTWNVLICNVYEATEAA